MSGKLTPRQRRFVSEYLKDLNATQAAIRAGYSEKTARIIAAENLSKPNIRNLVAEKTSKQFQRLDISGERILDELAKMGFANMADFTNVSSARDIENLTRDDAAAIQEFTVTDKGGFRFKLADKRGSLELLGKYQKLFTDRVEHDLSDDIKQGALDLRDIFARATERAARLPDPGRKRGS